MPPFYGPNPQGLSLSKDPFPAVEVDIVGSHVPERLVIAFGAVVGHEAADRLAQLIGRGRDHQFHRRTHPQTRRPRPQSESVCSWVQFPPLLPPARSLRRFSSPLRKDSSGAVLGPRNRSRARHPPGDCLCGTHHTAGGQAYRALNPCQPSNAAARSRPCLPGASFVAG